MSQLNAFALEADLFHYITAFMKRNRGQRADDQAFEDFVIEADRRLQLVQCARKAIDFSHYYSPISPEDIVLGVTSAKCPVIAVSAPGLRPKMPRLEMRKVRGQWTVDCDIGTIHPKSVRL